MALKIAGIEPVELGERKCTPKMDADKRLRLGALKFDTQEQINKAITVIASCFPNDEDFVKECLEANADTTAMMLVALYLRGGQKALDIYEQSYEKLIAEATEKVQLEPSEESKNDD